MQKDGSHGNGRDNGNECGADLEAQVDIGQTSSANHETGQVTIVIANDEEAVTANNQVVAVTPQPNNQVTIVIANDEEAVTDLSPKKAHLSRNSSSNDECRVCQQDKEEDLIGLGCHCRGGLASAHRSCIDAWFRTRGSNRCEICQQIASNVIPPEPHPSGSYWVWRVDSAIRGSRVSYERERGCFSPLWVAFSILVGGLLLDVLISITLGVSALPVNIIIGVIVVLGLGTALRLSLEFCREWRLRRITQRMETNMNIGYHPSL